MIRLRPSGADEVLIKRVRDWYEPGPGVFIAPQALFNPALLFTTGVTGTWYDPSDLNTLFQNAAGTTPVTAVEQPVGLMLDKSKGLVLGPELVTNGTFGTDSGWTKGAGWTISGGAANASAASSDIYQSNVALADTTKAYVVEIVISNYVSGTVRVALLGRNGGFVSGDGKKTFIAAAGGNTDRFLYITGSSFTGSIDNISVRELPGNHAFNPSGNSANFPVLSARYNLLTKTEDFSDAVWVKGASGTGVVPTVTKNYGTSPDGTNTASRIQFSSGAAGNSQLAQIPGGTSADAATFSIWMKSLTSATTVTIFNNADVLNVSVGAVWQRFVFTKSAAVNYEVRLAKRDVWGSPGDADILVWGADLRVSNDALNQPAYQRVNTATDYDTAGFKPYLKFNGTNQWLQTNSIDFSYGDKMFVSAGVRKLINAASYSVIADLSTNPDSTSGAFSLGANTATGDIDRRTYGLVSRGTILRIIGAGIFTAPTTDVLTGICDISGAKIALRVDGTQVASSTDDQGTGNYGNYPLYLGARAGSSLWFNGRLHQLVVAGKQASDSEIDQTEAFTNQKTGAY